MRGYQSHEAFLADIRMYFKMVITALFMGAVLQIFLFCVLFIPVFKQLTSLNIGGMQITGSHFINYLINFQKIIGTKPEVVNLNPLESRLFRGYRRVYYNQYQYWMDRWTSNAFLNTKIRLQASFRYSFLAYIFCLAYLIFFYRKAENMTDEQFIRGTELIPLKELNEKLKARAKKEYSENPVPHITIGETVIPREMETSHILVLGATRTGKGVLLNQIIRQINERKISHHTQEKIILYDLKGEFLSKHYDPKTDLIFYPYDKRSVGWNIFNEIETYPDFDTIAKSLYTATDTRDEYWYNCARDVFRMGLVFLTRCGKTTNRDLWDFFSQNLDDLREYLDSLPLSEKAAIKHIERQDGHQSMTILSIVQERIQCFRYLVDVDGDFSLRKYIRDENKSGNLYLLNILNYSDIFKPLMTFAIDTIVRETLSLPDKLDRRIFFILDEIGSLYKLESLLNLLTVGASKGGSLICANQDIGRIEDTYGHSNAKTFFNNFNTDFILRVNEPETAEFVSKAFGEKQVLKKMESRQLSPNKFGDSKGLSEQEKTERIFLPSEFQNLLNLESVVKISNFGISRMSVPKIFYPTLQEHFLMKEFANVRDCNEQDLEVGEYQSTEMSEENQDHG